MYALLFSVVYVMSLKTLCRYEFCFKNKLDKGLGP